MGIAAVLGRNPLDVAIAAVQAEDEKERRRRARRRIDLYQDNSEHILASEIERAFRSPEVKDRLRPFLKMACVYSPMKRVVDEIAKHTYNPPPTRFFSKSEQDAAAFAGLAAEMRLNAKMDLAVRVTRAANHSFLFPRVVPRLGAVLEVMDPSQVTIIPDPDEPCRALGIIYDTMVGDEIHHVFWDDFETFTFTQNGDGRVLDARGKTPSRVAKLVAPPRAHGYEMLPVVEIRMRESWGTYWDSTTGLDLENAQIVVGLLTALALKLHKSQGERQIVVTGETHGMPLPQVIDGESAIVAPEGTNVSQMDLRSDATHYTQTIDAIQLSVAAAYGISRERLNAQGQVTGSDTALLERRAETVRVFAEAEHHLVKVLARMSQNHPLHKMTAAPDFAIDFHEMEVRLSLKDQVEIWRELERDGLHSPVDSIRALNPEITSDEEAWAEFERNLRHRGKKIELLRSLNAPNDVDENPGRSPQENGALGPGRRGIASDGPDRDEDGRDGVDRMADIQ